MKASQLGPAAGGGLGFDFKSEIDKGTVLKFGL